MIMRKKFLTLTQAVFAIIVITALVFTACKRGVSQSTASYGVQTQITDTEEGFSAGLDISSSGDDLWFTAADTGLKVTFATRDILNQYENYITYVDEISPPEPKIIFTSTNAIDLEFLGIRWEYSEANDWFFPIESAPMASSIIRPDRPFVVNWEEQGFFPHRAVAFYDRNEVKRYFSISVNNSEEGRFVILTEQRVLDAQQAAAQQTAGELPSQHYVAADLTHWWRFDSGSHLLFFQSNTTFEFIPDGSVVKVYHVNEDWSYNLINEGTWNLAGGNKLFIEGEKGLGGGTPSYSFTFIITGDTLTMTDHVGNTAVFRRLEFQG